MYVCACVMHVYKRIRFVIDEPISSVSVCIYIHIYIYVCVYIYFKCVCYVYIQMNNICHRQAPFLCVYMHVHICMYTCICVSERARVCVCVFVRVCACVCVLKSCSSPPTCPTSLLGGEAPSTTSASLVCVHTYINIYRNIIICLYV